MWRKNAANIKTQTPQTAAREKRQNQKYAKPRAVSKYLVALGKGGPGALNGKGKEYIETDTLPAQQTIAEGPPWWRFHCTFT